MKTLSLILLGLSSLGLTALLTLGQGGAPKFRVGPLTFDLGLGVSSRAGRAPEPPGSPVQEEALTTAGEPSARGSSEESHPGDELFGYWVPSSPNGDDDRLRRFFHTILLPAGQAGEVEALESGAISDAEWLDRVLELEFKVERRRAACLQKRIS